MFDKTPLWAIFIISSIILVGLHLPALNNPFLHDDIPTIKENPSVRELSDIPRYYADPTTFSVSVYNPMYRPLLMTTYALNYAVSGNEPWSWRLFNILLHALNATLLFALLRRYTGDKTALAGGLLFLLHPMAGRTFTLVSSRSALLYASSFLLGMIAYLHFDDMTAFGERSGRPNKSRPLFYLLSLLSMAMGLLSVSAAVISPGFVLAVEISRGRVSGVKRYLRVLPFIALSAGYLVFRRFLMGNVFGGDYVRPVGENFAIQVKVFFIYLKMAFFPREYALFYPVESPSSWHAPVFMLAAAAIVLWVVLSLKVFRGRSSPFAGLLMIWLSVAAFPYAAVPLNVPLAEHHFYAPLACVAGLCAVLFHFSGPKAKKAGLALLMAIVALFALNTRNRDKSWNSDVELAASAVRRAPHSPRAWNDLGSSYTAHSMYDRALSSFRKSLTLDPGGVWTYYNMGITYFYMERYPDAVNWLKKYLEIANKPGETQYEEGIIGMALACMGRPARALPYLDNALSLDPERREILKEKCSVLLQLNRPEEALELSNRIMDLWKKDPVGRMCRAKALFRTGDAKNAAADVDYLLNRGAKSAEIFSLKAKILLNERMYGKALDALDKGFAALPEMGEIFIFWRMKGRIYEKMNLPDEAIEAYRKALSLPAPPQVKRAVMQRINYLVSVAK